MSAQEERIEMARRENLLTTSSAIKQLAPKSIPTLCETRWAGVYNCTGVLSLPIVRESIKHCCDDGDLSGKCRLKDAHWTDVENVRAFTHPFATLTAIFQGETYVTSSYYIFLVEWLKFQTNPSIIVKWKDALGNNMTRRHEDMSDFGRAVQSRLEDFLTKKLNEQNNGKYSPEDLISAFLDPRIKSFQFHGMEPLMGEAIEAVKKELMRYTRARVAPTEAKKVQEPMNSANDDEFACMMQPKTSKAPNPDAVYTDEDMVDSEVRRWLNFDAYQESEILKDCEQTNPIELLKCFNPLDFWETKKLQFPLLYRMACRYLPAPCAESFAERMFSSGGKLAGNCSTEDQFQILRKAHRPHQESSYARGVGISPQP
jgi:hypothetical protein